MKITVPIILVATILLAGIFAFIPVQDAATVHLSIQDTQAQIKADEDTTTRTAQSNEDTARITIGTDNGDPFTVYGIIACFNSDADNDNTATFGQTQEVFVNAITIDGNAISGIDGNALGVGRLINDGLTVNTCLDPLEPLQNANNKEIGNVVSSDGGDITIDIILNGQGDDQITSVKAVAIVDGTSNLTVTSSLP